MPAVSAGKSHYNFVLSLVLPETADSVRPDGAMPLGVGGPSFLATESPVLWCAREDRVSYI